MQTEKEKFDEQQRTVLIKHKCPKCSLELDQSVTVCPQDGTPIAEPLKPGAIFAEKYQLLDTIGTGGMGVIYRAKQLILDKTVAIKMVHAYIATPDNLRRFQQEGRAASGLSHPNIITVYDFGISDQGDAFMVMDYCEGRTLSWVIKADGPLSLEKFYRVFLQVCDALSHAHSKGVLHRDIKPSNIMLLNESNDSEIVKILDFGIAKIIEPDDIGSDEHKQKMQLTKTGEAIGSPLYMSPEQALGQKVDQRSDQYSLGCVMYESLTGVPPFEGATVLDTMLKHMNDSPMPLKEVTLGSKFPDVLQLIVFKLMSKAPAERYASMQEVAKDLRSLQEESQSQKKFGRAELPAVILAQKEEAARKQAARTIPYPAIVFALSTALICSLSFIAINWTKLSSPYVELRWKAEKERAYDEEQGKINEAIEKQGHEKVSEPTREEGLKGLADDEMAGFLDLKKQNITAADFKKLQGRPLRRLNLAGSSFKDSDLKELQSIHLENLHLDDTLISNAGLLNLAPIKTLKRLSIENCPHLDLDGVVKLHKSLPNCAIATSVTNAYGTEMIRASAAEAAKPKEALESYKKVIAALRTRPAEEDLANCLTYAYMGAGRVAFGLKRKEESAAYFNAGCNRLDKLPYEHMNKGSQTLYAATLTQSIPFLNVLGDFDHARRYAELAIKLYERLTSDDPGHMAGAWRTLAICLFTQGKFAEAERAFERERKYYDLRGEVEVKYPQMYADTLSWLGECARRLNELYKAETYYSESANLYEKTFKKPALVPQYVQALQVLTLARTQTHKYTEAIQSGVKYMAIPGQAAIARARVASLLATDYSALNRKKEAAFYDKMSKDLQSRK